MNELSSCFKRVALQKPNLPCATPEFECIQLFLLQDCERRLENESAVFVGGLCISCGPLYNYGNEVEVEIDPRKTVRWWCPGGCPGG